MTILYRADDPISARWAGLGRLKTAYEEDHNWYQVDTRVATLESNYTLTVSIDDITQPTPSQLLITMTDASTRGPFDIPVSTFTDQGDWAVATPYLVNDTFTAPNGGLYRVIFAHTSDPTSFDPAANDGMGHDFYAAMIPPRGNVFPAGGAVGTYLRKNSTADYDFNAAVIPASEVTFSPSSGSALVSTTVAEVVEELEVLISSGPGSLSGLSDVNITEGPGINGYFLTWDDATSRWVAAAASSNLSGLADVDVTEGPGIDGYFLQWDDGAGTWVAAASSSALAGLSDVDVTEGPGIDGYFLTWDDGTSKWIAATSVLSGLADVNVTEGSGINGYFLKWDNGTSKWVASLSGATATALSGLSDVSVSEGAPIDGEVLYWNNGTGKWQAKHLQGSEVVFSRSTDSALISTTVAAAIEEVELRSLVAANNLSDLASAATARGNLGLSVGAIEVVIDGGGSTITTGLKGYLSLPIAGTITEAKLLADQSGSIVVDIFKCTYSQFDASSTHPVSGDKITASAPPTISTATKSQDTTLTGWTTAFAAGDILAFNVNSVTSHQRVTLSLKFTK